VSAKTLMINEVFYSVQGESTRAGLPCVFVRLMGCHLRCGYCDTEYAFHEGRRRTVDDVIAEVERIAPPGTMVEVTGGEPLLQPGVHALMSKLCDAGRTVLLETSGACDISVCDRRVIRIVDLKTPGSGESHRNLWSNLDHLTPRDEVKIVLCDRSDFDWTRRVVTENELDRKAGAVLLSAVHEMPPGKELPGAMGLSLRELAEWVLGDPQLSRRVRVQTQLHKLIWDPSCRAGCVCRRSCTS